MPHRKPIVAPTDRERTAHPEGPVEEDRRHLIAALLRSDELAWRHFIHRFGPLIYRVLKGFPGLRDQRDDAFQEICIIIHRSLGSLRDPEKLAVWVYSIAYRHAADMTRKWARSRTVRLFNEEDIRLPVAEPTVGLEIETLERAALLLDLIAGMRPRCQQVLRALYIEDPPLSYEQLRERTGIPLGSIGPTRARCLDELKDLWNRYQTGDLPTTIIEEGSRGRWNGPPPPRATQARGRLPRVPGRGGT
jgi:RNA polymerase sigma factor (sigma-70 family)